MVVYTSPTCDFCPVIKKKLHEAGAKFNVVDVSEDSAALKDLKDRGITSAPVVKTDGGTYITSRTEMIEIVREMKKANQK
ncbi:NrdH-like glutaredoxin [Gordonia phage Keelan]|nr:NrdH-like glutaredoxin [Gordonia phage Keelan]